MGDGSVADFARRLERGERKLERKRRMMGEPSTPEERAEERMRNLEGRPDYWHSSEEIKRRKRAVATSMRLTDYGKGRQN